MPLAPAIKSAVAMKLEEYEGRYNHLYLDTVGKVTVGIGHMIPNKFAISSVPLFTVLNNLPATPATAAQKQAEFDQIAKQKRNYRAGWYKQFCKLVMQEADIDRQRDHHIDSFYKELIALYSTRRGFQKEFDQFPAAAQIALFDMIFNLGATKLKGQFIKFNAAIKSEDWKTAGIESYRPHVSPSRNNYVNQLFLSANSKSATTQP